MALMNPDTLTQREQDVLQLLCEGLSDQEIAQQLVLTVGTVKWYNKQIYGKLNVSNRAQARQLARKSWLIEAVPSSPAPRRMSHNLPAAITPFFGRKFELAEINRLLATNRLLTVTGSGGIGKTRLALQLAQSLLDTFPDGVFFVPLAPLDPSESILWTIAEHLHFQFQFNPSGNSEAPLLDYLRDKNLLLVLDNFEHMLSGAGLVKTMLEAAPGIKVVVTSRLRLNLYGEAVYTVNGLTLPDQGQAGEWVQNEAIQLFTACAQRVLPQFTPDENQLGQIARICYLVEGTPLGIELAAPWVETLTLDEIGQEIARNLDFLNRQLPDVPPRQHSIRAAFDYSWALLTTAEQTAFSKLSVFRGGFTRAAAGAVSGVSLLNLTSLVNKSLLRYEPARKRYHIHELLCQYAEEKLDMAGQMVAIRDAHMAFYAELMGRLTPDVKGKRQTEALETIEADFENIRKSWSRAVQTRNAGSLEPMLEPLYLFCLIRNRYQEGDELFHAAQIAFAPSVGQEPDAIWGHLLAHHLVHGPAIFDQVEQGLAITSHYGVQKYLAFGLWTLSRTEIMATHLARALQLCDECLEHYQALDDPYWYARLLLQKSVIYANLTRAVEAENFLRQALKMSHDIGAINIEAHALGNLGNMTRRRDDLPEAERLYNQAADLDQTMNDFRMVAWNRGQLGVTAFLKGDFAAVNQAAELASRAADYFREPAMAGLSQLLASLNTVASEDYITCKHYAESHIAHYSIFVALYVRLALAMACCGLGEFDRARQVMREFIQVQWEWGDTASVASVLALEAFPLAHEGQFEYAVELLALAYTYPRTVGGWLHQWPLLTRLRANLKAEMGEAGYNAAWERGKLLDLSAVVKTLLVG